MGSKEIIPYGLYRTHGFINAALAEQTGFNDHDRELLWQSLDKMFDTDRSASRGDMAARELLIFKHDSKLGNLSAHRLFDRLRIDARDDNAPPRSIQDYKVTFDGVPLDDFIKPGETKDLGGGVSLTRRI